ncbi:porin [Bradyrhizobium sp. 21]|uniref:porin n=1 Tax=Bradyrhizobium sp. 21 TaxID=2782666 RepID=UPI001FFB1885|nr:porin [Bradyrhizobium sp. 21]MCK1386538.1 hypothetical protein [Bradyrhizobium sp. 21]
MRALLFILVSLLTTSAAAAEALRLPPAERPQAARALPVKDLPLKGAGGTAKAGSCASYGRGFYLVEATGTCVKIGGSISVETTVRR